MPRDGTDEESLSPASAGAAEKGYQPESVDEGFIQIGKGGKPVRGPQGGGAGAAAAADAAKGAGMGSSPSSDAGGGRRSPGGLAERAQYLAAAARGSAATPGGKPPSEHGAAAQTGPKRDDIADKLDDVLGAVANIAGRLDALERSRDW